MSHITYKGNLLKLWSKVHVSHIFLFYFYISTTSIANISKWQKRIYRFLQTNSSFVLFFLMNGRLQKLPTRRGDRAACYHLARQHENQVCGIDIIQLTNWILWNGHFYHIEVIDLPFHTIPFVSCVISLIDNTTKNKFYWKCTSKFGIISVL